MSDDLLELMHPVLKSLCAATTREQAEIAEMKLRGIFMVAQYVDSNKLRCDLTGMMDTMTSMFHDAAE
jgi:hypothetical protein